MTFSDYNAKSMPLFQSLNILPFNLLLNFKTTISTHYSITTNCVSSSLDFFYTREAIHAMLLRETFSCQKLIMYIDGGGALEHSFGTTYHQ